MLCINVRPQEALNNSHSFKKETLLCFSPLKWVLLVFCLFSIQELFSNQSISAICLLYTWVFYKQCFTVQWYKKKG